jgi:hypothetical protein
LLKNHVSPVIAERRITSMLTVRQSVGALVSLAIIVGIAGAVGYGIGVGVGAGPRMSETKVFRDIPAFIGDTQMTAFVDDVAYGVSGEVAWVDASGSWHARGWPACAPTRSQSRITFGGAVVYGPTGTGDYRMLWVDCRQ